MKSFKKSDDKYIDKFKVVAIPALIIGLVFAIIRITGFPISDKYLRLEVEYIISSFAANYLVILLTALSAIMSLLVVLPAIKNSKDYINRFKIAAFWAMTVGLILGFVKSIAFVFSNGYLQLGMYYLIIHSVLSIINSYLLVTLGTTLFVFIVLYVVRTFLSFTGVNIKTNDIITCGIFPALLVFVAGGYWINEQYLPEFHGSKSIVGNAVWVLICILLVWATGWLLLKIPQIKFDFSPRVHSLKVLVGILGFVILLNLIPYFYSPSFKVDRPNVILISIDTLRADHLSCYGYYRGTPNIDGLAKDGVLFANTIAQASWTLPSHMSLLTGLYSSTHGVMTPNSRLNYGHLTLAEILQSVGYKTVAFTDGGYLSRRFGYQGFDRFDDTGNGIETIYIKSVNWLRKSSNKPFFLFLHTYQPHVPYNPPADYDIYSDKNYNGIVDASGSSSHYDSIQSRMTLEDYQYVIDKYDGEIYYTDYFLGRLFEELKNLGLYDKSVIVFTSDHGENFLDHAHSNIGHTSLYDEVVKVPLIIKASMLPWDQIINAQVESIDVMPTMLELLGISIANRMDGKSLVELVKKGHYNDVFAFSENSNPIHGYPKKMIRNNDWKLLLRLGSENKLELYDLKNDPREQNNLVAEQAEVGKILFEKLNNWMNTQEEKSKVLSADRIELNDELTEQLKALGYIN